MYIFQAVFKHFDIGNISGRFCEQILTFCDAITLFLSISSVYIDLL